MTDPTNTRPATTSIDNETAAADHLAAVLAPIAASGIELPPLDAPALLARAFEHNPDGTLTPRAWANDPGQLATVLSQHAPPVGTQRHTAHPCPPWCEDRTSQGGHAFTYADPASRGLRSVPDSASDGRNGPEEPPRGLYRVHRHRFGPNPTHVAMEAWERIAEVDAPSDYGTDPAAIAVALYGPSHGPRALPGHLSPTGARELARQLLAAADLADAERATTAKPDPDSTGGGHDTSQEVAG
jgi:hypothetical protein